MNHDEIHIYASTTPTAIIEHLRFVLHELGHSFEFSLARVNGGRLWAAREAMDDVSNAFFYRDREHTEETNGGFAGGNLKWQFSRDQGPFLDEHHDGRSEIFADMFIGWVYNQWATNNGVLTALGQERYDFCKNTWTTGSFA